MPSLISAIFCLKPRARGQSALLDSLHYLSSPASGWNHTLVGWTGEIPDDPTLSPKQRAHIEQELEQAQGGKVAPVWLPERWDDKTGDAVLKDQGRWRRYAEHELYTLFHYRQHEPTDGRRERIWWADYYRMNKLFADRILQIYKPGDYIWIHDYHLLLVPSLLRQVLPQATIGFFLHIPFPSSEFLRCLSRRKEILEGVLGANLIGFQSYGYSRHFSSCCKRILGFEATPAGVDAFGAHVAIVSFPIGIDVDSTYKFAFENSVVQDKVRGIQNLYSGKKLIVGRDRLDTVKGIVQKLQAFEKFLKRYPEWHEKVVLVQVVNPISIEDEKEDDVNKLANRISEMVERINGTYGSLSFSPVRYYPQYISKEEYFALLRVADVGLITSVRDGMNTTGLEYVVCQKDNHGPLILSEFSGTAGNLNEAMRINPWDLPGVAKCLDKALGMSDSEKAEASKQLYAHVSHHTVQEWAHKYLDRLQNAVNVFGHDNVTPSLDRTLLLSKYRSSRKRLFMFDYDGTLTPIVQDPLAAIPSDRVIRTLKTLAADPLNSVWIISGRDQAFLDEWMGHIPELGLSAEHGSFIRHPFDDQWENVTAKTDMSWQQDVMHIFQHYTEKTQGSFIERKKVALTWHYRRADPEYGTFQAKECRAQLEATVMKKYEVEVMEGKANLEVRPSFVNKGAIASRLVNEAARDEITGIVQQPPDFVLCLGDDFTDEDMFRALKSSSLPKKNVFSCTVGPSSKVTEADWHLLAPADVLSAVAMLNGSADDVNAGPVGVIDGVIPRSR
ncbi:MAG: hypothetical protein Q9162_004412 [Coniocarpon cinnabarinum]